MGKKATWGNWRGGGRGHGGHGGRHADYASYGGWAEAERTSTWEDQSFPSYTRAVALPTKPVAQAKAKDQSDAAGLVRSIQKMATTARKAEVKTRKLEEDREKIEKAWTELLGAPSTPPRSRLTAAPLTPPQATAAARRGTATSMLEVMVAGKGPPGFGPLPASAASDPDLASPTARLAMPSPPRTRSRSLSRRTPVKAVGREPRNKLTHGPSLGQKLSEARAGTIEVDDDEDAVVADLVLGAQSEQHGISQP